MPKFKFSSSVVVTFSTILLLVIEFSSYNIFSCDAFIRSPSIKLENGKYNGILIGIDGEIEASQCANIINRLEVLLNRFSEKLYQATNGRASLGQVNILLPLQLDHIVCGIDANITLQPEKSYSFQNSHIQVKENHPMIADLPWTKQYRACGEPSDVILIPLPFILNDQAGFNDLIRGQLLLHEWTKFRYGAFDEIGYDEDHALFNNNPFPPCYTSSKQAHLTCCSDSSELSPVLANASACSLDRLLSYKGKLKQALGKGSTSIMSAPYIESVAYFCNATSHNPWSPTKQNLYCNRSSVAEVVFSHIDFKYGAENQPMQEIKPAIKFFKHQFAFSAAYAFVIEDSQDMRDQFKIQHVKQAIAQFLQIMDTGVPINLFIFSRDSITLSRFIVLKSDAEKQDILNFIPDATTKFEYANSETLKPRLLLPVINQVIDSLATYQSYFWNVFLFANFLGPNDSLNDMPEAIRSFEKTSHSITIFTFETDLVTDSSQWLNWYKIPNTKNVVALPYCTVPSQPNAPCIFRTASFILAQFIDVLNDQQFDSRFLQNSAGEIIIQNKAGEQVRFVMPGYNEPTRVKSLYFFMSIPQNTTKNPSEFIRLNKETEEGGETCIATSLLGYNLVLTFTGQGCSPYHSNGIDQSWSIVIDKEIVPGGGYLLLNVWSELHITDTTADFDEDRSRLIVIPSLGMNQLIQGITPDTDLVPVYVALQTHRGNPVLDANVSLQVFHTSLLSTNQPGSQIVLRDDGDSNNGADQTGNDGVYSAYLNGFSPNIAAFHIVQLQIETNASTKILDQIQPTKAVLMDEKLNGKCCGKIIQPMATSPLIPVRMKFQTLHLGFKTLQRWSKPRLPPGDVSFKITGETNDQITIEFENSSTNISSYEACCITSNATLSDSDISPPSDSSCKADTISCEPQGSTDTQSCYVNKRVLVDKWIPVQERKLVDRLICSVRAVNTDFELGKVSFQTFEVYVTAILAIIEEDEQKCTKFSIDDKCLPLWIFWVMIGCLGLLLLIIIIMACCWYFMSCRKKEKTTTTPLENDKVLAVHYTPPPASSNTNSIRRHDHDPNLMQNDIHDAKVVKELFVNHAYITDGDGDIKIIADNGQILRKPKAENTYKPAEKIEMQVLATPRTQTFSASQPPMESSMQIFKPVPMPKSKLNMISRKEERPLEHRKRAERPEIIHSNPMLKSDSTYDTPPRRIQQQQLELSSPTRSNTDPALVYATISRSAHLKPPRQVTFDPHYMVPHNSTVTLVPTTQNFQRQLREPQVSSSLPPQAPNYPDSDTSTTDFDHHKNRGQGPTTRRLPPRFTKPPAYPTGSQIVSHQNNPRHHLEERGNPIHSPPVPPPRYDRSVATTIKPKNNGAVQNFSSRARLSSDDDSDDWDDGDNYNYGFDNTTGVSYA